jgi:hypothetical protein
VFVNLINEKHLQEKTITTISHSIGLGADNSSDSWIHSTNEYDNFLKHLNTVLDHHNISKEKHVTSLSTTSTSPNPLNSSSPQQQIDKKSQNANNSLEFIQNERENSIVPKYFMYVSITQTQSPKLTSLSFAPFLFTFYFFSILRSYLIKF